MRMVYMLSALLLLAAFPVFSYSPTTAASDLDSLCTDMPNMIGCLLRTKCNAAQLSGPLCNAISLVGDICDKDPMMSGMSGCSNYLAKCMVSNPDPECLLYPPLEKVVGTAASTTEAVALCALPAASGLSVCQNCQVQATCANPLDVLSKVCMVDGISSEDCKNTYSMCANVFSLGQGQNFQAVCGTPVNCVSDSSNIICADYVYPSANATADLNKLCTSMPYMIGCSIRNKCTSNQISGKFCSTLSILGSICAKDVGMSMMSGCENYLALCATGTEVSQCTSEPPIPNALSTVPTKNAILGMCSGMPMSGCSNCNSSYCPDPLDTISSLCISMPMAGCANFTSMCTAISTAGEGSRFTSLCSSSTSGSGCVSNPNQASCQSFMYPEANATADLEKLCDSMPNMIGCSVYSKCNAKTLSGKYCKPFSILGDICGMDTGMSGMNGCQNYNSMCATGSQVSQCVSEGPIPKVISTVETQDSVTDMCSQMYMEGCNGCTTNNCPDPLQSVSTVCNSMEMSGCKDFNAMCSAISSAGEANGFNSICGQGDDGYSTPLMRMYFHTGVSEYILFYKWVPKNPAQYWLSCIAVVVMGVVVMFLKSWRHRYDLSLKQFGPVRSDDNEKNDLQPRAESPSRKAGRFKFLTSFFPTRRDVEPNMIRGCFAFFIITLDYALMLIAMTFNVGLFFAVILGLVLGTILFGHGLVLSSTESSCCG